MERTKFANTHSYNHHNEPLIVPKQLIEIFLKEEYCENLLMLYSFYYYTAKWQGTSIPRSTTEYTSRGLNWGVDKVRRTKKKLIELGLVEDLTTSDETGKITGHFIKVNLLQISYTTKTTLLDSHPVVSTQAIKNKENTNKRNHLPVRSEEEALFPDGYITPKLFESFWTIYPRKIDRGKTLSKWLTICKYPKSNKPTWEVIQKAIQNQKKSQRWQELKYIPHPTTWLNQRRWLDDPKEMISFNIEGEHDKRPKFIKDPDSGRYDLCPDGLYRHCVSGEVYIP